MGRWHAWAIKRVGGYLSAVADIDQNAARHLTRKYRGTVSFSNVEQMLDRIPLDVLHICTPAATHYKIAELAIEAGLNLMIEKPMTLQAREAEHLFDQAESRGVLLCPVHQFLFQDGVLKARKLLPRIGRLVHMEGVFYSAGGTGLTREQLDFIVADILPHPLSLMYLFLPTTLPEKDWLVMRPGYGELRALGESSGVTLVIFISMNARPTVCSFQIIGTTGTIHLDLFHGFAFMEPGKVARTRKILHPFDLAFRRLSSATLNLGRRIFQREPAYPGLRRLVADFYKAVQTRSESPISQEETLAVARIRDRLIQGAGLVSSVGPKDP